ncbi:MAG TPA: phosphatase domain-containing protein [Pyrinomonadaceae bacterium]|nr:phosphatase domain-containing protein [Pyrinomonadaceae bacterium]
MNDWKARFENLFERIDDVSDDFRLRRRRARNFKNPLMILPFFGFGTTEKIYLKGRVLENEGEILSTDADSVWRNLANMYRRFETDEVPFAKVRAAFQGAETEAVADKEGYFEIELSPVGNLAEKLWHEVELELLEPISLNGQTARTAGQILTATENSRFGVISDIDDTVMTTNVTNRLKMLLTTLTTNEHMRIPFEGVAAFYRALQRGAGGAENNPIFYVSSSPWNLYTLLIGFFQKHEIPLGPLFLKDFGTHTPFKSGDHQSHKLENIKRILETFQGLPFILVGDSGEQDPEIYYQVVKQYPNRIRAVYIRDVNPKPERVEAINKLIAETNEIGSELVFARDSEFAARHAAAEGLIAADELENIRVEKKIDEAAPSADEIIEKEVL